jgi:hypothetical protein
VEKLFPDMIMEDESGDRALAYTEIIPIMLVPENHLQKEIDELTNKYKSEMRSK